MSYQYIETLFDEALKRYQQLNFVFPFAETRWIKRMWRQMTEKIYVLCFYVFGHL